jgi:hypothetical protein
MPLRNIGSLLPCHSHVDPATVVGALNHVVDEANSGETVFYDLYTDDEKKQEPARAKPGCSSFAANRAHVSRSLLLVVVFVCRVRS